VSVVPPPPPAALQRLASHAGLPIGQAEAELRDIIESAVFPVLWASIGQGRPAPSLEWAAFRTDGRMRLDVLGSYDAVGQVVRLHATALAIGLLLRRHPATAPDEACFATFLPALHPAAVARPLVHALVHESVHAATPVRRLPLDPSRLPALPADAAPVEVLRWPFYEQVVVRLADGSVVGTAVEPRHRGLLEGLTDAIAGQLVAALAPVLPDELRQPLPDVLRLAHPRLARPDYPAREVLEALFEPAELLAMLTPATEPEAIRARLQERLPVDLFTLAWGTVSGDLDRFAPSLPPEHPFRRLGWHSIAAWLRDPDAHVAA
jgi:hypothetical protein